MTATRSRNRGSALPGQDRIEAEILLVEDQRSLAMSFAKMLHERWGCKVLIATTFDQVKRIVAQKPNRFFVTISDLVLPDAPNGEVIDLLMAAGYPTIAMTGVFDQKMHGPLMNKGVIDYVLKKSVNAYDYLAKLVGRLHRNMHTKILAVDDETSNLDALTRMLAPQRLEVLTAKSGKEALVLLERHPDIRLMMIDFVMPGMNGVELVAAVRNQYSMDELAIIGFSAFDEPLLASQFLKVGANDFIAKPFTYDELVLRISSNLDMLDNIATVRYIAYHDYLTGLLNRRAFFERGSKLCEKATADGNPLSVAMMDLDHFKRVNDSYGHDGGDAVLRHVADLIVRHFGDELVGRLGGEEFTLIANAEAATVRARCEAFRAAVEKSPAVFGERRIPLTVSIGLADAVGGDLDATIKRADEFLYQAKSAGRNRVVAAQG